jgi:hypothetical protein
MSEPVPKCHNYRICYDNGNAVTGKKIYELHKYCNCEACHTRFKMTRMPRNQVSATTSDISKVDEVADYLKTWTCGTDKWIRSPVFLKF